jgi:Tfp pilus assembly major pilin PilA
MKITKRTWIILAIGIAAILGALVSLYYEKESEIADLEESLTEPSRPRKTKKDKAEDLTAGTLTLVDEQKPQDNHEPGQE